MNKKITEDQSREIFEIFCEIFPRISRYRMYKLFMDIKYKSNRFEHIFITRLTNVRFGISERQMQAFIYKLREVGYLELDFVGRVNNKKVKNFYKIDEEFFACLSFIKDFKMFCSDGFDKFKKRLDSVYQYIYDNADRLGILEVVKMLGFKLSYKYGRYRFNDMHDNKYIISKSGENYGTCYNVTESKSFTIRQLIFSLGIEY